MSHCFQQRKRKCLQKQNNIFLGKERKGPKSKQEPIENHPEAIGKERRGGDHHFRHIEEGWRKKKRSLPEVVEGAGHPVTKEKRRVGKMLGGLLERNRSAMDSRGFRHSIKV